MTFTLFYLSASSSLNVSSSLTLPGLFTPHLVFLDPLIPSTDKKQTTQHVRHPLSNFTLFILSAKPLCCPLIPILFLHLSSSRLTRSLVHRPSFNEPKLYTFLDLTLLYSFHCLISGPAILLLHLGVFHLTSVTETPLLPRPQPQPQPR